MKCQFNIAAFITVATGRKNTFYHSPHSLLSVTLFSLEEQKGGIEGAGRRAIIKVRFFKKINLRKEKKGKKKKSGRQGLEGTDHN